jgi:hypothetical protein
MELSFTIAFSLPNVAMDATMAKKKMMNTKQAKMPPKKVAKRYLKNFAILMVLK